MVREELAEWVDSISLERRMKRVCASFHLKENRRLEFLLTPPNSACISMFSLFCSIVWACRVASKHTTFFRRTTSALASHLFFFGRKRERGLVSCWPEEAYEPGMSWDRGVTTGFSLCISNSSSSSSSSKSSKSCKSMMIGATIFSKRV